MRLIRIFAALLSLAALGQAQTQIINGVNVVVNDAVITFDQVESAVIPIAETLASEYRNDMPGFQKRLQQLRSEKIEDLIQDKLVLDEFKTAGYMLPESFIEDAIREKIHKQYYGERSRLIKELQSQGLTFEMFRKHERERIIIGAMREQNISMQKVLISPAKISTFYNSHKDEFKVGDQVRLRMISINQMPGADPGSAKRMAEEILRKIEGGVPFAEMAGVYATSSQRAEGGDRGWVDRTYFKAELADVAFSLKAGQHSKVVELAEACYLMQVDDVRPAHVRSLGDVRSEIEKTLRSAEQKRLQKKWVDRLKAKSFVRYF